MFRRQRKRITVMKNIFEKRNPNRDKRRQGINSIREKIPTKNASYSNPLKKL
jgi:hypothetical protein